MNKKTTKVLALTMAASMALSACSNAPAEKPAETPDTKPADTTAKPEEKPAEAKPEKGEPIKDLVRYQTATSELETFNALASETSRDFQYLTNLTDGLVEVDNKGQLVPAIASEWGTEDGGLTWTFKLRDGVKWVDVNGNVKGDCTSADWLTGMEWILNYHKNESANTTMPMEMIKGATEYYEYTKALSPEEALALNAGEGSKFRELVGIEAPDANTLVYHCLEAKPYFDTVAAYACLYPLAQGMIDELGSVDAVKAMNNETMWYNGAYTMTSYIQGNEKTFTPNPEYWDKDCTRFDSVTYKMLESGDVAYQLYQSGEIDYVGLGESNLKTIVSEKNEYYDQLIEWPKDYRSYQFHLNYSKNNEDGTPDTNWNTAIANEAFRLSWYYGMDLKEYYSRTNAINPMSCENNFYTTPGLIYNSKGVEYTEIVREKMGLPERNGETMIRLDKEKAEAYKKQAIEELTALGVTFPVEADFYIPGGNQGSLDSANVLKQVFSNSLGDDYVVLNIKTYVSSQGKEVLTPKLHSFNISGWSADYGDPQNYLGQETYGNDGAYYSRQLSMINDVEETEATKALLDAYKEYTALVDKANAICDDLDARYDAYAEAEAYLLQHALTIPNYYNIGWCLSKINLHTQMNAKYGMQNEKMKNWETSTVPYTTEQFAALTGK